MVSFLFSVPPQYGPMWYIKCLLVPKAVLFWPYAKPELVVEELKSPVALEVAGEGPNKPVVVPAPTWFCGPFRLAW